jgi:group I intron endonuclease
MIGGVRKMDKVIGIYCIENIKNNKRYIGQSIDVNLRLSNHKSALRHNRHRNIHLQDAWNKYGEENFNFYIICECTEEELDDKECCYILEFNCMNPSYGYNFESGGNKNKHPSDSSRQKMSESHIGLQAGENNPSWGIPKSAETKKKISDTQKERFKNKENHPMFGRCQSQDTKAKISFSRKGKNAGENHPFFGKTHSEEERKKISQNRGGKPIFCPELNENFWGASEAEEKYGISHSLIIACCRGKRKHTGRHPFTGEPLSWQYSINNNTNNT